MMAMRYDYSTIYLENARTAEEYLTEHRIPFVTAYDAVLNQWTIRMELEKEEDFDKLEKHCGINSVRF